MKILTIVCGIDALTRAAGQKSSSAIQDFVKVVPSVNTCGESTMFMVPDTQVDLLDKLLATFASDDQIKCGTHYYVN